MAVSITIRDVPDKTRDELAARAARDGKSLQEFLKAELVRLASRPDLSGWLERIEERKRAMGTILDPADILDDLQADRQ